jgi:hypothetical protein
MISPSPCPLPLRERVYFSWDKPGMVRGRPGWEKISKKREGKRKRGVKPLFNLN